LSAVGKKIQKTSGEIKFFLTHTVTLYVCSLLVRVCIMYVSMCPVVSRGKMTTVETRESVTIVRRL